MKKSLLVTLADKNYIAQAKQLFSSLYFNAGWSGDYMLLSYGIPESELGWFRDRGILIFKCDEALSENRDLPTAQLVFLAKFCLFQTYFKKWETVLYLDTDIIVRYSLEDLAALRGFNAALEPCNAATLGEQFNDIAQNHPLFNTIKEKYNLHKLAFNAGVFVFSTDLIEDKTFDELISLFLRHPGIFRNTDQGTFNLYFYKRWNKLSNVYNFFVPFWREHPRFVPVKIDAVVLHCFGKNKPWIPTHPFYQEWVGNLERADAVDLAHLRSGSHAIPGNMMMLHALYFESMGALFRFYYRVDRFLGRCGLFLRKISHA